MTRFMLLSGTICLLLSFSHSQLFQEGLDVKFKGAGWIKMGRIMHSTDTVTFNVPLSERNMQDAGALFNTVVQLGKGFEGSFGIGAIQNHKVMGITSEAWDQPSMGINSFVNMARLTYTMEGDVPLLQVNTGLFSYKYDNNIRNMGLYLLRGPVYPNVLISGFESKEMLPIGNVLGLHIRNRLGENFTQDLILGSEMDMVPSNDYSLIYVANYKIGDFLELGAGVNFYHLFPVQPDATSPSEDYFRGEKNKVYRAGDPYSDHQFNRVRSVYDSTEIAAGDTNFVWTTNQGTKAMVRFGLDPKPFIGSDLFGKNDLKLYGELGVIGITSYDVAYENIAERIPVVIGFNIPTFGGYFKEVLGFSILDLLALEVEYYGNRQVPDYTKLTLLNSTIPTSPYQNREKPDTSKVQSPVKLNPYDVEGDDWKWSLYFAKIFAGHIKFSGQAACDHLRTGGSIKKAHNMENLTDTFDNGWIKDWYWMLKLTFFF